MRPHQKGRETAIHCRICSRVDQFASIIVLMKIRNITLLPPVVSRKPSSWDKISWKESVASCLFHSFWRSMGKEVIVLINRQQIPTSFGSVNITGMPSIYFYATFFESIYRVRQRWSYGKRLVSLNFFDAPIFILLGDFLCNLGKGGRMVLLKCPFTRLLKIQK